MHHSVETQIAVDAPGEVDGPVVFPGQKSYETAQRSVIDNEFAVLPAYTVK